jgi:hypothetical protein
MRTEIKRTVFMEADDVQRMVKAFLSAPEGSGLWIRPEVNSDETMLIGLAVEWIEPGPPLTPANPSPSQDLGDEQ